MRVADFDYHLPPELIAQVPTERRDESRLLVLHRDSGRAEDRMFKDIIGILRPDDLLVLNDTKVIRARIYGLDPQGRKTELLLLRELEPGVWEALSRPSRRARVGARISYTKETAEILEWGESGVRKVRFSTADVLGLLEREGEVPLPPYIKQKQDDLTRYQTVYARNPGAVAAPTAGLHFTSDILEQMRGKGIEIRYVTLHAGLGTFRPVKADTVEEHRMYEEEMEVMAGTAQAVNHARAGGRRIVAGGTTVTRALEACAVQSGGSAWEVKPSRGMTDLFIAPGYRFRVVDALLTNFHLPRSTLLMLVAAFASLEAVKAAYQHAIQERYRFYSFGDAMLIV
jgi:S-adenosylmethionine:tRNA ribosyltransferase-isomerase